MSALLALLIPAFICAGLFHLFAVLGEALLTVADDFINGR